MIDLHTHTIFSDGELIPSELARRAEVAGYRGLAFTDHGDAANLDFIIPRLVQVCRKLQPSYRMRLVPGIELTHVPPHDIASLAAEARKLGARIVVVHGETLAEPVAPGTNHAALLAEIDILAHPGLIAEEDALLAARNGIALELSARRGHALANGHVAKLARRHGASLIVNTDAHAPADLVSSVQAGRIAAGAGLTGTEISDLIAGAETLLKKIQL
jgi:histidinol phosphatase-like PHP family hydrolase